MNHSKLLQSDNMDSLYSCLFLCPALSDGEIVEKKMLLLLRRTHLSKETRVTYIIKIVLISTYIEFHV